MIDRKKALRLAGLDPAWEEWAIDLHWKACVTGSLRAASFTSVAAPALGLPQHQAVDAFRAFDLGMKGCVDEEAFVLGLAAAWPSTPHTGPWLDRRLRHIFALYDHECEGSLPWSAFRMLVRDVAQAAPTPEERRIYTEDEVEGLALDVAKHLNLPAGESAWKGFTLEQFGESVSSLRFRGTSRLFRLLPTPASAPQAPMMRESLDEAEQVHLVNHISAQSELPSPSPSRPGPPPRPLRLQAQAVIAGGGFRVATSAPHPPDVLRRVDLVSPSLVLASETGGARLAMTVLEQTLGSDIEPNVNQPFRLLRGFELRALCHEAIMCFQREKALVQVPAPCKIVGDIHGQLRELLLLFRTFGRPWHRTGDVNLATYVFLGDYVDRGPHSLEVATLMLALKVRYPDRVFLLRGNHEFRMMNVEYGFLGECQRRLGEDSQWVWEAFNQVFDWMPFAAVIGKAVFAVHGGIGDEQTLKRVEMIGDIQRPWRGVPSDPAPSACLVTQLIWSDPTQHDRVLGVHANYDRRVAVNFGPDRVGQFMRDNPGMQLIVRAHQCVPRGYELFASGRLLTMFSAARYYGLKPAERTNDGALMEITSDLVCYVKVMSYDQRW